MHSSLKCRGHAGCSCTYQITTSSSDKHSPPCTSSCPPHTHTHSIGHILYKHTQWSSMCLHYTAGDVVIVYQRAVLEPTGGSAVLLAPQRQYPLSHPLHSLRLLSLPPSSVSLASDFCSYVTHIPFIPCSLSLSLFLSLSEAGFKTQQHSAMYCRRLLPTGVYQYPDLSFSVSFFLFLPDTDIQANR